MNRTWLLLRTKIINYFSLNEIMESGSRRKTTVIAGVGIITLGLFFCIYNILTAQVLVQIGEEDLIPAYMAAISSFVILILTMLRANGIIFGSKDMDMLSALPVKSSEIIGSRLLFMYLINFLFGVLFIVPGGIIWVMNTSLGVIGFILYFASMFFVPMIPMCIASLIGILILLGSSHFKNRNILSLIFSFATLGLIGYIGASNMKAGNDIGNIGAMLAVQITKLYPLSKLFMIHGDLPAWVGLGIFIILSSVVFYLFIKLVSIRYNMLNVLAGTTFKYSSNHKKVINRRSQFIALYRKEFGRLFSSYMAILNTGLGVIMLCIFSVLLLIVSPEQLGKYSGIENIKGFLSDYSPVVISAMLSLSCSTAYSISLEGKNIWILQSTPVSVRKIINSKLAVNLTIHSFAHISAVLAIMIRLRMNLLRNISVLLIPIAYSLFTSVLGVVFNKKYPIYTWENEMMVVKQSLPVMASNIIGMIVVALPVLLHLLLSFPLIPALWTVAAAITLISGIMYQRTCKSKFI